MLQTQSKTFSLVLSILNCGGKNIVQLKKKDYWSMFYT